jgi:hypothetical protein
MTGEMTSKLAGQALVESYVGPQAVAPGVNDTFVVFYKT